MRLLLAVLLLSCGGGKICDWKPAVQTTPEQVQADRRHCAISSFQHDCMTMLGYNLKCVDKPKE